LKTSKTQFIQKFFTKYVSIA